MINWDVCARSLVTLGWPLYSGNGPGARPVLRVTPAGRRTPVSGRVTRTRESYMPLTSSMSRSNAKPKALPPTSSASETFLVVLDEAHLYRGAAGAEVGLLLRRLRDRLGIPSERFRVICATASFRDAAYASEFGAQLSGVSADTFIAIQGEYAW